MDKASQMQKKLFFQSNRAFAQISPQSFLQTGCSVSAYVVLISAVSPQSLLI